jgi:Uma2 family endonuclease
MIARRGALMASALKRERPGPFTWDDFCRLVGPKQKADLIDGVIYVASPDNTDSDSLIVWLISLIDFYVEARNLGRVFGSRVALRLDDTNSPEPDISFVRRQRLSAVKRGGVEGAADFVIEIVSPDSVERDYKKKFWQYARAGIGGYWIVDEMLKAVTAFRLDLVGDYQEIKPKDGVLYSRSLPGFWLRPEWLWQQPRPNRPRLLKKLLAKKS